MAIFKKKESDPPQLQAPSEIEELKESVGKSSLPPHVEAVAQKELEKLSKTNPTTAEYTIGINYIDYLLSLPWSRETRDNLDIRRAEEVLDQEHYGLRTIKDRILEHLAVRALKLSRQNRILVVDDEEVTCRNLEHVLQKEGHAVLTATNGLAALEILKTETVDLIITDLKMEQMDGLALLEKARALCPGIRVIVITGYGTVSSAVEAMKKGSFHYITKPFRLDEIRTAVAGALENPSLGLEAKAPILCFVGPPGTGKTSLGKSIAHSLEKKFIRISLAGMKDEAEIRGHRRSYVGALPGRIIQEIRRAECKNPVFMLDEIDKIAQEFKGDPAAPLLEVLDPEQNTQFVDHYLDVPFDLSRVMFIATANTIDPIPGPLLDRLEVIPLSGYTEEEKEKIAFRYLIPRAIQAAGLYDCPLEFTPEAVQKIIRAYTREAGLRNLSRQIDAICRKAAREILTRGCSLETRTITPDVVQHQLGTRRFYFEVADAKDRIGVVTGLAWTETGGEIMFIEATRMKGKGDLILTGSLGTVMKESAHAALSYIRSNTDLFQVEEDFFENHDLHIHVPAGAIPKDGPSAGITIAMALISLLTRRPARREVALTGELTLSGRILPVAGVREKVLAARRAGVSTVVFPAKNDLELTGLPEEIRRDVRIVQVVRLDEILDLVLR